MNSKIFGLLKTFCPAHLYEEIEGDLIYKFSRDVKAVGERRAKRKLMWNVIRFFRPGIVMRNRFNVELNQGYMLQRYFKIAYRHLMKSKTFSFINLMGLAIALAAFFMVVQYIGFESGYDQFHVNKEEIYRIGLEQALKGEVNQGSAKTFAGVRRLLKIHFPEVKNVTGFYKTPANTGFLFRYKNKVYNEDGGVLNPDSAFFKVFPSLLVRGNAAAALSQKKNLILSESMAYKIFGDTDPIGQLIERIDDYENGESFVVTGIMKDIPGNAHFHASFIRHIDDSWPDPDDWKESFLYTYVTLQPGSSPDALAGKINAQLRKMEKENPILKGSSVFLQPVTAIHLSSHFKDELEANGNRMLLYGLAFIGVVILAMAWINYVNLEAARFILRSKEISIRRITGSRKLDLAMQFLVEYFCLNLCALLIAVLLLIALLPYFSTLTSIPLTSIEWTRREVWMIALCLFIGGSVVTGIYPTFSLLQLNPVDALKGRNGVQSRKGIMRQSLVVIQFTASLVLIAFVLIVNRQLDFMRATGKKAEIEHVIALENPMAYSNEELQSKYNSYKAFEDKLLQGSMIKMMASSSAIPGTEIGFSYINLMKRNRDDDYDPAVYKTLFINHQYISTYGLKMLAGHNFPDPLTDGKWMEPWQNKNWTTLVLNESAIKQLGFGSPAEAIDQEVDFQLFDEFMKYRIIGVVEDYYHEAVKKSVYPTIYALNHSTFQQVYYSVRLNAGADHRDALAYIQKTWNDVFPDNPFNYFFLDDYYDQQYRSEERFRNIFTLFTGVAVFIACLGILGMTLFEANARLKEISVRKLLGASPASLVALLSRGHLRVILLSALVATPVIFFVSRQWLSTYPVRIDVSALVVLVPLMLTIVMVILTSGIQTVKAANTNPVDHLKNE